jgi:hypothetical protein
MPCGRIMVLIFFSPRRLLMRPTLALALFALAIVPSVRAGNVTFEIQGPRLITRTQEEGGVPSNAGIFEFFATTDADILQVEDVVITPGPGAALFQTPAARVGSDVEPPLSAFEAIFSELGADSWITTPGPTEIAGDQVTPLATNNNVWYDVTDDGPQTHFMFARLTVSPYLRGFTFSGKISLPNAGNAEDFPFSFVVVPEPSTSLLLALAMTAARPFRRWRNAN